MFAKLWLPATIILLPASAIAQNLTDTHEQISIPGKTINAYRPIAQNGPVATKCHPDATKAVACEAMAQRMRADAWAARRDAETAKLGSR